MLMSVAIQPARNLGTNPRAEPDRWTDTWKSGTLTVLLEPSGSGGWIFEGARQAKASRYEHGRFLFFSWSRDRCAVLPLGLTPSPDDIGCREGLAAACSFAQPQRGKRRVRRDRYKLHDRSDFQMDQYVSEHKNSGAYCC
jgi:hypothetical protein